MLPDSRKRRMSKRTLRDSEELTLRDLSKRGLEERRRRKSNLKERDSKESPMRKRLKD